MMTSLSSYKVIICKLYRDGILKMARRLTSRGMRCIFWF